MLDEIVMIVAVTSLVMLTPGPDMVLVVRNTLTRDRHAGLRTSLGILLGNMTHITYCVLGVGWIISRSIVAYSTLKYAGAAYLIYLGITSLRAGDNPLDRSYTDRRPRSWFLQGLVNNLLNPKGTLFYLGVFTTVITPDTSPAAMLLFVVIMMMISATFWVLFVYTIDRSTVREFVERSQKALNRAFGALLIVLGLRVALSER